MLFMEEYRLHEAMMGQRMMFGKTVSKVVVSWGPEDIEVSLLVGEVAHPMKARVDGFRALLLDGPIDDAVCGGIVGL
jgi:hypothetical protein